MVGEDEVEVGADVVREDVVGVGADVVVAVVRGQLN